MGDNGQGDVCAAQSMLESKNGDRMVGVLIHVTEDPAKAITDCQQPNGDEFTLHLPESDKVHYHTTHSDAAAWLLKKDLLSCCWAKRVYEVGNEWYECRCPGGGEGGCDGDLPTGVNEEATKEKTLAYCEDVEKHQLVLLGLLERCSGDVGCEEVGGFDYGRGYENCKGRDYYY